MLCGSEQYIANKNNKKITNNFHAPANMDENQLLSDVYLETLAI